MRGRVQLSLVCLCALAPIALGAQVASQPPADVWTSLRGRLPWPITVGQFDSLRSGSARSHTNSAQPPLRLGTSRASSETVDRISMYRAAAPAEPSARKSCPMPVYAGAPVIPMPGSAPDGVPVAIDSAFARAVLCDNPLDRRRR